MRGKDAVAGELSDIFHVSPSIWARSIRIPEVLNIMNALRTWCPVLVPLVAFGAVACGSGPGAEETRSSNPVPDQVLLKGHAVFGHEVRTIRPCGEDEGLWAIDGTGLLWGVHRELVPGMEPYEEVFVVVRGSAGDAPSDGFGADYPGSFVVDQVLYAAGEGFGCDLDLSRFQFRLSGNEPFWTLSLADATAELSRMGAPGQIWSDGRLESSEAGFRYVAEGEGLGSLEVSISEDPCRDTMSGAFYGYRASVVVAGEEFTGCALSGAGR